MLIGAEKAPWHYILLNGGWDQSSASCRTVGGRATPTARKARLAAGRGGGPEKALAVLFDLGLGQRVEIGENIGPRTALRGVAVGGRLAHVGDAGR